MRKRTEKKNYLVEKAIYYNISSILHINWQSKRVTFLRIILYNPHKLIIYKVILVFYPWLKKNNTFFSHLESKRIAKIRRFNVFSWLLIGCPFSQSRKSFQVFFKLSSCMGRRWSGSWSKYSPQLQDNPSDQSKILQFPIFFPSHIN